MIAEVDVLLIVLDPDASPEARKTALTAFAREAWIRGWEACDAAYKDALAIVGLMVDKPEMPE